MYAFYLSGPDRVSAQRTGVSTAFDVYGQSPANRSPAFSSNPIMRFMFWTAWPDAPFTRLSMAVTITALPVLPSAWTPMSQKFEPRTFRTFGNCPTGRTRMKGSFR